MSFDKEWLETDNFDVIIVGTGFIESTLSGALSRAGKTVLTLDPNTYYGGFDTSFSLNQLITTLNQNNSDVTKNTVRKDYIRESTISINKNVKQLPLYFTNVTIVNNEVKKDEIPIATNTTTTEESTDGSEVQEQPQPPVKSTYKTCEDLGRSFSIDILPTLLYSRGPLVSLLIQSSTAKYLEFKNLDQNYLYFRGNINEIPSTKGSIFKDNTFSLIEKRTIMKFITVIQELFEEASKLSEEQDDNNNNKTSFNILKSKKYQELSSKFKTYYEFIKSQKFTEKVETFILHGITLKQDSLDTLPLQSGIESVYLYISSLLVYSPNPFLLPYYGCGDIPQAFVRVSAVFGGTFVLNRAIDTIQVDSQHNVTGIICDKGQPIQSKHIVISPKFLDHLNLPNVQTKVYSRFIGIANKRISNTQEQSLIIVPPNSISNNKNVVDIIQMENICTPYNQNKVLYHITTVSDSKNAEVDLKPVIETFFNLTTTENSDKPNLLWYCYFNVDLEFVDNQQNSNLPSNLFLVSDSPLSGSLDYQHQIDEAKKIFSQICPNQIFLEKVPDQEDIIYNYNNAEETNTNAQDNTNTDTNTSDQQTDSNITKENEEQNN